MNLGLEERSVAVRAGLAVGCSTLLLTAAFVGLLALVRGAIGDLGGRLPYYVLGTAFVFVTALFTLENPEDPGIQVITTTVGIGLTGFVLIALAGEGTVYAVNSGGELLTSQIVLYFVAAALICTALGYWALHHWREFVE